MPPRLALALPLLLAACMGTQNRGPESIHQPIVSTSAYAIDLRVAGAGLDAGERHRLAGWLAGMRMRYGDRIAVDDPEGTHPEAREEVASLIAERGLFLADRVEATPGAIAPGTIRVVLARPRADVPGCPDWSRDSSHEFDSNTSSNYGCASNSNLAAMIANPGDLVSGARGDDVNDPAIVTRAIESFRKSAATGKDGLPGGVTSTSVIKAN